MNSRILLLFSGMLFLIGCSEVPSSDVRVQFSWTGNGTVPETMHVYFYPTDGGEPIVCDVPGDGGTVRIDNGWYDVLAYNTTDRVYATNTGALATTVLRTGEGEQPDRVWRAYADNLAIASGSQSVRLQAAPAMSTCTWQVTGIGNLSRASAVTAELTDLSAACFVGRDVLSDERVTVTSTGTIDLETGRVFGDMTFFGCCTDKDRHHYLRVTVRTQESDTPATGIFEVTTTLHKSYVLHDIARTANLRIDVADYPKSPLLELPR